MYMANENTFSKIFLGSVIALVCLMPMLVSWKYGINISGDSAVYFTYLRDFSIAPFHYGYTVKQGATSPLWVSINAAPFSILGLEKWTIFAASLNTFLIIGSMFLLANPSYSYEGVLKLVTVSTLILGSNALFRASSSLYETALTLCVVSAASYFYQKSKFKTSSIFVGLSILCRPELAVWAFSFSVLNARSLRSEKKAGTSLFYVFFLGAMLPALLTYIYLWVASGYFMPSSVAGRLIIAGENSHLTYIERVSLSYNSLDNNFSILIAIISLLLLPWASYKYGFSSRKNRIIAIAGVSVLAVYILFPPLGYSSRYLIPLLAFAAPIISDFAVWVCDSILARRLAVAVLSLVLALWIPLHHFAFSQSLAGHYDWDTVLGKDFGLMAGKLGLTSSNVLLAYEIQTQFYTELKLISLDGIVGGEFIPVIQGKQLLSDFIQKNKVSHIATMNSLKYRNIFTNTGLVDLYNHDLQSNVGDSITIKDITFRKIATHPCFSNLNCYRLANGFRVYSGSTPKWEGHHFFWNSLYEIVD